MYLKFYGLREEPFGVTPDPRFLYLSPSHREAQATLEYGIKSGRGFTALVALPGMGKTTLLYHLLEKYSDSARTAFIFQTQCDAREFMRYMLAELGFDIRNADFVQLHEEFNQLLLKESHAGKKFIIVVDESQNLDFGVLEAVRLLSDFETRKSKLLHVILAGQPELADKLASPELEQLRQRISHLVHLVPLSSSEVGEYIEHRLRTAGYEGEPIFTPDAVRLIAQRSEGIPRIISNLCFNALSLGYATGHKKLDSGILHEVSSDLDFSALKASLRRPPQREELRPSSEAVAAAMSSRLSPVPAPHLPPPILPSEHRVPEPHNASDSVILEPLVPSAAAPDERIVDAPAPPPPAVTGHNAAPEEGEPTPVLHWNFMPRDVLDANREEADTIPTSSVPKSEAESSAAVDPTFDAAIHEDEGIAAPLRTPENQVSVIRLDELAEDYSLLGLEKHELKGDESTHDEALPGKRLNPGSTLNANFLAIDEEEHKRRPVVAPEDFSTRKYLVTAVFLLALGLAFLISRSINAKSNTPNSVAAASEHASQPALLTEDAKSASKRPTEPAQPTPPSVALGPAEIIPVPEDATQPQPNNQQTNSGEPDNRDGGNPDDSVPGPLMTSVLNVVEQLPPSQADDPNESGVITHAMPPPHRLSEKKLTSLLRQVDPIYPPAAKLARLQGRVVVKGIISQDGFVRHIRVVRGNALLAQAAMDAIKDWRYKPRLDHGRPVEINTQITVNFILEQNANLASAQP